MSEEKRARFRALQRQRKAILEKSLPMREERDLVVARMESEIAALDEKIKKAEKGLFEIDMESAEIARSLRTGDPFKSFTGEP
jgi:predicted transcriptional regulator